MEGHFWCRHDGIYIIKKNWTRGAHNNNKHENERQNIADM